MVADGKSDGEDEDFSDIFDHIDEMIQAEAI